MHAVTNRKRICPVKITPLCVYCGWRIEIHKRPRYAYMTVPADWKYHHPRVCLKTDGTTGQQPCDGTGRSIPPAAGSHIMSTTGRRDSVTADDGTGKYIMSRRGKANDYSKKKRCKYSVLPTTMDDNFCVNFCCLALMIKLSLVYWQLCLSRRPDN